MKQQSRNKAKRWLTRIGAGVMVLCLAAGGFWYWINIPPQIDIPNPVMPKPNGYDYFQRAGEAFVPDNKGVDEITDTSPSKSKKYSLAAKEAWLKKNAKALHFLREGLKYPALHSPSRSYFGITFPEHAQARELARALVIESHARAERGDFNGAVQSALNDYHFGNQIARGGPLIAGFMSTAICGIGLRELRKLVSYTNTTTARKAAASMEKIYADRYPFYKTLQEEKWQNISANLQIMAERSWRLNMVRSLYYPNFQNMYSASWLKSTQMFFASKRSLINDWIITMNALIQNAQRPYSEIQPVPASGNPLVDASLFTLNESRWGWARRDTSVVEIMTMYALRAYKLDNGHYPKNLKALVPTYLHKIPIDPFDGIAPMQYELRGENYLLWSIGPDGVDNHGTPITNKNQENAPYLNWSDDSKGDVVAGKNTP